MSATAEIAIVDIIRPATRGLYADPHAPFDCFLILDDAPLLAGSRSITGWRRSPR